MTRITKDIPIKPTYGELRFFIERLVAMDCDDYDCSTCSLSHSGFCKEARDLVTRFMTADEEGGGMDGD